MPQTNSAEPAMAEREITEAMLKAGYDAYAAAEWEAGRAKRGPERDSLPIAFRAMLAASPLSPPVGAETDTLREAFIAAAEARDAAGFVGTPAQCIEWLSGENDRLHAALAAPDAVTPAPAGGGIEGLRALSEAATPGEWHFSGKRMGGDCLITASDRVVACIRPWTMRAVDDRNEADASFIAALINAYRSGTLEATRTPAGAAVDPVGVWVEGLRSRIISAAQIHLGKYDIGVGEYEKIADAALANRPASQAPAASERRSVLDNPVKRAILITALTRLHRAVHGLAKYEGKKTLFEVDPSKSDASLAAWLELNAAQTDAADALKVVCPTPQTPAASPESPLPPNWLSEDMKRVDGDVAAWPAGLKESFEQTHGATLAPTAQAQPAGREEIEHLLWLHIGIKQEDGSLHGIEAAADAILAARPVADGVAGAVSVPISDLSRLLGAAQIVGTAPSERLIDELRTASAAVLRHFPPTPATAPAAQSIGGSV